MCVCAVCVPGAHGVQKRTKEALELELQIIVSLHVGAGSQTLGFRKTSRGSYLLLHPFTS